MNKNIFRSKTFWAAVCGTVGVVGSYLAGQVDLTQAIIGASGFWTAFGIRDSLK